MKLKKITPKQDQYMLSGMKPEKSKPMYPKFRLDLNHIPEAKKWDVSKEGTNEGPEYIIEMKVKMIGLSQSRFDNSAEFEIRELGIEEAKE